MRKAPTSIGSDRTAAVRNAACVPAAPAAASSAPGRRGRGGGCGHDPEHHRDAGGARDLLHGADDRRAVRVELRLQRRERRREQRGERQREADRQHGLRHRDEPHRGIGAEGRVEPQHRAGDHGTGHEQHPRAPAVVDATDEGTGESHRERAGQHHETRGERVDADHVLQVQRHHGDGTEERHRHDGHLPDREREVRAAEHAEVEQRVILALQQHLAPAEQAECDDAHGQRHDERGGRGGARGRGIRSTAMAAGAQLAEPEDQSAEAEGRQDHRQHVDRGVRGLAEVVDPAGADDERHDGDRQHHAEDPAPLEVVRGWRRRASGRSRGRARSRC